MGTSINPSTRHCDPPESDRYRTRPLNRVFASVCHGGVGSTSVDHGGLQSTLQEDHAHSKQKQPVHGQRSAAIHDPNNPGSFNPFMPSSVASNYVVGFDGDVFVFIFGPTLSPTLSRAAGRERELTA